MNIIYFITILVILLNLWIGFARKGSISLLNYTSEPNAYKWPVIVLTMSATVVGGGMFIGVSQIGYEAGFVAFFLGIVYLLGFLFIGFFSPKIRKLLSTTNTTNLVDLINSIYGKKVMKFFCIANLLMYCGLIGAQFTALWEFKKFIEINHGLSPLFWVCIVIAFIAIFLYPIIGGLKKDIQTDVLNMIVVLIAIILFFFGFAYSPQETFNTLSQNLTSGHYSGNGIPGKSYGILFIIGSLLFLTPSFIIRMDIWQRIITAKSNADSKKGFILAGLISLISFSFFGLLGMIAYAYGFKNGNYATLDVINSLIANQWIKAIIIGAFFSALLNSADTFINNVGIFATKVFHFQLWNSNDEKGVLSKLRVWSLALTMGSILLAFIFKDFVNLLAGSFSIILIFLPTIIGLFEKKWRNAKAAYWSSLISFIVFLVFFGFDLIGRKLAFVPSVFISILIYVVIFKLNKRETLPQSN